MKKIILLVILAVMAICLIAYGIGTGSGETDDVNAMTFEEFKTYVSPKVELTTDNWSEYFEIVEDEIDYEEDEFGELTGNTKIRTNLWMKKCCYNLGEDVLIELTQKMDMKRVITNCETKEVVVSDDEEGESGDIIYSLNWECGEYIGNTYLKTHYPFGEFSLEGEPEGEYDYEIFYTYDFQSCKRIKGTVVTLNVPEELWQVDENGDRYLAVILEDQGESNRYYEGYNFQYASVANLINKMYEEQ